MKAVARPTKYMLCILLSLVLSRAVVVAFTLSSSSSFTRPLTNNLLAISGPSRDTFLRSAPEAGDETVDPELAKVMYTLGIELGMSLGDISVLANNAEERTHVVRGIVDVCTGRLDMAGCEAMLKAHGEQMKQVIRERATQAQKELQLLGEKMLDEMASQPDAIKLASGVVVQMIETESDTSVGSGLSPSATSSVEADYHGTFADGTVFDSSLGKEGDSPKFALAGVIEGWRDGFQELIEGQVAMLGIPSQLAYGPQGTPDGAIPPNATLFFKVKLVKVLTAGVSKSGLVGADGKALTSAGGSSALLGADGKPL